MYINGVGNIASTVAPDATLPTPEGTVLHAIEPDYGQYINPRLLRRMARIIKMGVAAADMALKDARVETPDAIITATGLGCSEDTEIFLRSIIENNETLLSPTAFIKSTHNTIGGQIALMMGVNGYNMTYAHRGFSFESALLDAQLLLAEQPGQQVLVGGVDELTPTTIKLLQRVNCISSTKADGKPIGGEGAGFFICGAQQTSQSYAKMLDVSIAAAQGDEALTRLLERNKLSPDDIDLVLTGAENDNDLEQNYGSVLQQATKAMYKPLCGSWFTSSTFACWLAATMLKTLQVPETILAGQPTPNKLGHILICNRDNRGHQSLILLAAC